MTKYEMISTHTADAVQYVAPTLTELGNVDEIKALCDEAVEQEGWSPLTGQTALVVGDASLANTDFLLKFDDGSVLILDPDEFAASGYEPIPEPAAPTAPTASSTPAASTKTPTDAPPVSTTK